MNKNRKHGFVLLIVVIMLAITCLLLYQVAALSFGRMREVVRQEKQEREKWSLLSLRISLLPQARHLFEQEELRRSIQRVDATSELSSSASAFLPMTQLSGEVELNDRTMQVELFDENAKFSITGSLRFGRDRWQTQLQRLVQGSGMPLNRDLIAGIAPPKNWCWQDVFETGNIGTRSNMLRATDTITLWGDGKLNLLRADEEVLDASWRMAFGHFPPTELIEERLRFPKPTWPELRSRLGMRDAQYDMLERSFTVTSTCFSMQLKKASSNDEPEQVWLFVNDRNSTQYGFEF